MTSPFVRRRRLATELRAMREERGITAEELAGRLHKSRTLISKLENAHARPNLADIMKILDMFGVTGDRWQEIVTIARDATERGWWDTIGDAMGVRQRLYADVESGAMSIHGYIQLGIPGVLQTPEFTWALIELDKAEGRTLTYVPEQSIRARAKRQEVVFRSDGPHFEVVLDEFVLRRLPVPDHVMAAQLHHMVDVITRQPRFSVRVLPLDARLSSGRLPSSTHMIYNFPDPDDPPLVIQETATAPVYTAPDEVALFERLHDRLRQAALPALESLSLLADTAHRLSEQARTTP